jgi:hypothetical protein
MLSAGRRDQLDEEWFAGSDQPFIHIQMRDGVLTVEGDRTAELGHRIDTGRPRPDGVFAQWNWDGLRLSASNCRFGMYPLYYAATCDSIIVSPSIPRLLDRGAGREIDADALSAFLRLGFFLGEDTPFAAIRAMPPGGELTWGREGWTVSGTPETVPRQDLSRDQAIDGYIDLFKQAIDRRRTQGKVVVPLSGGRDSRHILLELHAQGRLPDACITTADPLGRSRDDETIAGRLCSAVGVRHIVVGRLIDRVRAERLKNLRTGMCSDEHVWMLPLIQGVRGFDYLFDGIAGDVLSAGLFLTPENVALQEARRFDEVSAKLLGSLWEEPVLRRCMKPDAYDILSYDRAHARLVRELSRFADFPNPRSAFFFWNRTRREIALAPFAMMPEGIVPYCPYLDHDLFDLLVGLPSSMTVDHMLHDDTIARAYPRFRDIPYERKPPPSGRSVRTRAYALQLLAFTMKNRSSPFVPRYIGARTFLKGFLDGRHDSIAWHHPEFLIYLVHLGEMVGPGRVATANPVTPSTGCRPAQAWDEARLAE